MNEIVVTKIIYQITQSISLLSCENLDIFILKLVLILIYKTVFIGETQHHKKCIYQ